MTKSFFLFTFLLFFPTLLHAQHISLPPQDLSIEKNWPAINSLIQKDQRHILINIWASWCLPCKKELPVLNSLDKNTWQLITVNADQNYEDALNFLSQNNLSELIFKIYHDPKLEFMRALKVQALPATLLLSPSTQPLSLIQGDISSNPLHFLSQTPASN